MEVLGPSATGVAIRGNQIGTDVTGSYAVPNGGEGVLVVDAFGVLVGGVEEGAGNLISANAGDGVRISGTTPEDKAETFDLAHVTALNGWTGFGNREHRDNFGFSHTDFTRGDAGSEAGGKFARGSSVLGETTNPISYYADPRIGGTLTLDDPLRTSGELVITEIDNFDGSVQLGYFDRGDAEAQLLRNQLLLRVAEPSSRQGTEGVRIFAEIVLANGQRVYGSPVNTPAGIAVGMPYTWQFDYDPEGGSSGNGRLEVEVFADGNSMGTSLVDLTQSHRNIGAGFDAFGLHNGGNTVKSLSPNTITLYVDNLTYTREVGNRVTGNRIGVAADGASPLGNAGSGISIDQSQRNRIERNVVSHNLGSGVDVVGESSLGNTIRENALANNGGLAIDLAGDGMTANDPGDGDTGPNGLTNFPLLTALTVDSGGTRLAGQLDATPNSTYTIDLYRSVSLDASGRGEGARWITSFEVTTDTAGLASFISHLPGLVDSIPFFSVTATDASGSTSEFGPGIGPDTTPPTSWLPEKALPAIATSLSFAVPVLADDPSAAGEPVSGVASVEVYVSVDGDPFTLWKILDAVPSEPVFAAESNHTYAFRTVARDQAGNVEVKANKPQASIYVPDLDAPVTQVDAVKVEADVLVVRFSGEDTGGSGLAGVQVIVEIDGGKPRLIGERKPKSSPLTDSITYQPIADGQPHQYRFYTRGFDRNGNREAFPTDPAADVIVTAAFEPPLALDVVALDVQQGGDQRSFIRHLETTFNTRDGLDTIFATLQDQDPTNDRVRLVHRGMDGTAHTPADLDAAIVELTDQQLRIDFGPQGIGGNRNSATADGFYDLEFDLDGDGHHETVQSFYRLLGDTNGDRRVDTTDLDTILGSFGRTGVNLPGDVNGDGVVNILDRLLASRQLGKSVSGQPNDDVTGGADTGW